MSKLILPGEADYRNWYNSNLANGPKGLRLANGSTAAVYFERTRFDHAFYKSMPGSTQKHGFEPARAERMGDIVPLLLDATADRYVGWNNSLRTPDHTRTVCVAAGDDFVVVLRLGLTQNHHLKANFVTCYVADNSIGKIRSGMVWDEATCLANL